MAGTAKLPTPSISDELGYIGNMLRWGASVEKICSTLGVPVEAFEKELESNEELREVVREAKLQRDEDIQRAFFESCVGAFRTTTSKRYIQHEDGTKSMEATERTEYIRPDAKMMALMLKNIDPWFTEKDSFEQKLALEGMAIRRQIAEKDEWKPVSTIKVRGKVKKAETVEDKRRRLGR